MSDPLKGRKYLVSVTDRNVFTGPDAARVDLGHDFLFVHGRRATQRRGKAGRLGAGVLRDRTAIPILGGPVTSVRGLRLLPTRRQAAPLSCLVSDRDLYRAEQDSAHLFVAVPEPPEDLVLAVELEHQPFTERKLDLGAGGMAIETLAMLTAGSYSAQLRSGGLPVGSELRFTVAEYQLAPLSGRLVRHRGEADTLEFELAVESYQVAFDQPLRVALMDGEREVGHESIEPLAPGSYSGRLRMQGEGPFRLRLQARDDPSRVAEVPVPGSRAAEREVTVLSELGEEALFSLMPEADALPVRGGWISAGDTNATPLVVEELIARTGRIHVSQDVEGLVLIVRDLTTGELTAHERGDLAAGTDIDVDLPGPAAWVACGCFVNGEPFEGYATFLQPQRLELELEVPETARPGEEVEVRIGCEGVSGEVPVLLCVRDQRLTATDTPEKALAASLKAGVALATEGMDSDEPFVDLLTACPPEPEESFDELASLGEPSVRAAPGGRSGLRDILSRSVATPMSVGSVPAGAPAAAGGAMDAVELAMDASFAMGGEEAEPPEAGAPPDARAVFPAVLFYGLVAVDGQARVSVPLGDAPGTFAVEAFSLAGGDWAARDARLVVDQPLRLDLELPPAIQEGDRITGRLRVANASGESRIRLERDGEQVALSHADGRPTTDIERHAAPLELRFSAGPGTWKASVEDRQSDEIDAVEIHVGMPGRFKSVVRELALLQEGEELDLESEDALALRVLPGLDEPFSVLVEATACYTHLCCEQTAAKVLSAVAMHLLSEEPRDRARAEDIVLSGIERERKMWLKGRGLSMYPGTSSVDRYWGPLAVGHLWSLRRLADLPDLSPALRRAVRLGLEIADDAGQAYGMEPVPKRCASIPDAYAVVSEAGAERRREVEKRLAKELDATKGEPRKSRGAVMDRVALAYGAACYLALGDRVTGLRLANAVTRQLNSEGRLYSTVDSVAAIALMVELRHASVLAAPARLRVNGEERSVSEAVALSDQVESVEVLEGVALVEVARVVEEDWQAFRPSMPVKVGLRREDGSRVKRVERGERVELHVKLPRGYETGDLLHVSLPACLSWIHGGAKVKRFSRDFEGEKELRLPLVVTEEPEGRQHWAACVRNMFVEERVSALPGLSVAGG